MVEDPEFLAGYPDIELEALYPHFPRIRLPDDPVLSGYSWEDCHRGFVGAGGLILVSEMAEKMRLRAGMKVLDLCCGTASSAIFMAKHYGVRVTALDLHFDPAETRRRVEAAGLADGVTPVKMDARSILLPGNHFDAVFCLNSYFYFGTEDAYLPYLTHFIRPGGKLGIASPCYADELQADTPREFLYDAPDYVESHAVHSPSWWRAHFEKCGLVHVHICEEHPDGRELWLDDVRWLLESSHPRDMKPAMRGMIEQQIVMLMMDRERFVTYLTLVAEKRQAGTVLLCREAT